MKKKKLKPQYKGVCSSINIVKPRKPNSAQRKIAKIKKDNKIILVKIPGIKHNLNVHSEVLYTYGKTADAPGVKYKIIRGTKDASPVKRTTSRSKYGCKKNK